MAEKKMNHIDPRGLKARRKIVTGLVSYIELNRVPGDVPYKVADIHIVDNSGELTICRMAVPSYLKARDRIGEMRGTVIRVFGSAIWQRKQRIILVSIIEGAKK